MPVVFIECHEFIKSIFIEDLLIKVSEQWSIKQAICFDDSEVNYKVPNASAAMHCVGSGVQECSERYVLEREVVLGTIS